VSDLDPRIVRIADVLQEWVSETAGGLVTQAVVLYETVTVNDDGDTERAIFYTVPTDNFAISGALGLIEAGRYLVRRDALNNGEDDE
jgi:hypothetical protein